MNALTGLSCESFEDQNVVLDPNTITIIHYNDVYDVEPQNKEPIGGAARFCSAVKSFAHLDPIILFSGDCFSPSLLSTVTKGEQMVPVLNAVGTHCACFGNHEFDFGLDILADLVKRNTFPWLMSNVIDNETDLPLGDGKVTHILESKGKKIGLMGLVEIEWLETLSTIDPDAVTFRDFVEVGNELAVELRQKGCDIVIALTHMRQPNDQILAEKAIGIDLILGGHDHVFSLNTINDIIILKSGTDFRDFSVITTTFPEGSKPKFSVERISVTSDYGEDPALKAELAQYSTLMDSKMADIMGDFHCDLDGRFASVRTSETNLGNFLCDIMVASMDADCALLNSGTIRSDTIHPAGPFTRRDLLTVLPMMDALVVLNVTGAQLLGALENGVSQYPKLEGRFPQVAGIRFAFNPKLQPGKRVDPRFVVVGDEYLQLTNKYRLVTKAYIATGHDGYTSLSGGDIVADEEACLELSVAVQNHFHAIQLMTGRAGERRNSRHHQSLVTLSRRHSLLRSVSTMGVHDISLSPISHSPHTIERGVSLAPRPSLSRQGNVMVETMERKTCKLEPKVEGRIVLVANKEILQKLIDQRTDFELNRTIAEEDEDPKSPHDKILSRLQSLHDEAIANQQNEAVELDGIANE